MNKQTRDLGTFTLAMITVAAIVSLRNLPLSAEFGLSSVFFLLLAAGIFFVPIALVTAELASTWPRAGGCYTWVSEAFNKQLGFFTLWMAWMESIVWFPAILAFTATMFAHMLEPIFPKLVANNVTILCMMLIVFWGSTIINFSGMKLSGWISSIGVICGTLIPGIAIIILGLYWFIAGKPIQIVFSVNTLVPDFRWDNIVIFAGVLLGLAGVELAAFHVREVENPQRNYPYSLLIAAIFILSIYILGTLAIAMVVPQQEISLASGLIQAFKVFFHNVGWSWVVPFIALFLFIGSLAGINTWTVGPAKGLLIVAEDGFLPKILKKVNKHNVPVSLLILQAIIGSMLSMIILYLDDKSATIWVLTALSAQFTFVQYFLVFIAAFKLRFSQPYTHRVFKVPMMWLVCFLGILACIFSFLIVYLPPRQLQTGDIIIYRLMLILAFVILTLPPIFLAWRAKG